MTALWMVLLGYFVVAGLSALVGGVLGRRVFALIALAPMATLVWAGVYTPRILDGDIPSGSLDWVPGLGLSISVRVDAFSLLMVWLIAAIGLLVCVYGAGYFGASTPRLGGFAGSLTAFAGSMVGLVVADDLFALFLFWELTSVTSFLLIGFNHHDAVARASALQAFLITVAGGLTMLGGFVILSVEAGTSSLSEILADPPGGPAVTVALVLVVIGAATKSAQFPFHFWLPAAMAAPTPVSAFLHSATMVNAGVYLVARFSPTFASESIWRPMVISIGIASMLVGAVIAMRRSDLKQILAYGTISQLGLMFVLFGFGDSALTTAGVAILVAHALYKAAMFMMSGIIDHQTGTRDIGVLSGLGRALPALAIVSALAAASMAGIPPLLGFAAKELAVAAILDLDGLWMVVIISAVVAGSILTVAYSGRVVLGAFATKPDVAGVESTPPSSVFFTPLLVLAGASLLFGLMPMLINPLLDAASAGLIEGGGKKHLALWPGFNSALLVSLLILAAGILLVVLRARVDVFTKRLPRVVSGERLFGSAVTGLLRFSERVTSVVQSGSLPTYLAVIMLTAAVVPGTVLVGAARWPDGIALSDGPIQAGAAIAIIVAAATAVLAPERINAIVALGAVGLGVAVIFIIEGGPDLALTQLLVETVVVVAFALTFRHLPQWFRRRLVQPRFRRVRTATKLVVAGTVGTVVTVFALTTVAVSTGNSSKDAYLELAPTEAGGNNVVNTILVDFRALDTLGEITVLMVAALGVLALVRAARADDAEEAPDHSARDRVKSE